MKLKHIFILLLCFSFFSISAQTKDEAPKKEAVKEKATVSVKKSYQINSKTVPFDVTTGYLSLENNKAEQVAKVFYTAYIQENTKSEQRPIMFAFNGGPGSASVWLHLGVLGPKIIEMTDKGETLPPPYKLIENKHTWLDLCDIVFIDPVGTGFSRPETEQKPDGFYGFKNDAKWVSEFIRQYVNANKRWDSPKYLCGESYGTTRAVGVADYLMSKHGMYLNGIVLVSCALDFETLREYDGNNLPFVCNLPAYSAAAFYHKQLADSLQADLPSLLKKAEHFAINTYAPFLLKGDWVTEKEKLAVAKRLSQLTGIDVKTLLDNNLRMKSYRFRKQLMIDSLQTIGRFDSRLTIFDDAVYKEWSRVDPSFVAVKGAVSTCMNSYVRKELGYEINLPYHLIGRVQPWEYENGKYLNVIPTLRKIMIDNPSMKVWVANGYYDMATSYFGTEYALSQAFIPKHLQANIFKTYYEAGHMMYYHKASLVKMKKDAVDFFAKPENFRK